MSDWKIYTKTGDKGETSLLGGRRVPKHHLKIEAYGTADELNAFIGLLRDQSIEGDHQTFLKKIQDQVFTAESWLACDKGCEPETLPVLDASDIQLLEEEIDRMDADLPILTNFILPGGDPAVSYAHVCRCICRRAERVVIQLSEQESVSSPIQQYFNRLSDYFFVLARRIAYEKGIPENLWNAEK